MFSSLARALRVLLGGLTAVLWMGLPMPAEATWPVEESGAPDSRSAALRERAADLLSRAIRIPTANPPGNEAPLAALLLAELEAAGIEVRSIPTPSGGQGGARAAAWARVPGSGRARPVVLLSHLDVVPADPSEWSGDPYAGRRQEGFVTGRGALDAKGVAVVHLLTLLELARRDTPLDRDVIFLATPDEERGGVEGAGFLARERQDLLMDAEYLLTEGGSIRVGTASLPSVWGVTVTEKTPCWLELSARGSPGHGSSPSPDAAVPRLVAALDRVRRIETPIRVLPAVTEMFRAMAPLVAEEDRAGYTDLAGTLESDPAFRRRFLDSPARNALVRNTLSITVLEGGSRTNMVPAEARAHLDARLLPGESCEEFRRAILEVVADPAVSTRVLLSFPARSSPTDTALFSAIQSVAGERDPEALVIPRMIGGFTDAHWFRELGVVAYGFVPRRLGREDARGVHGIDERISLENLELGVRVLTRILEVLAAP
jgi:acetylornithine deacetylase/succinyl-diaminopimelate desuccinylase-like protein